MTRDVPKDALTALIARAEGVLARVEAILPPPAPDPDWRSVTAARWRKRGGPPPNSVPRR